MKIAHVAPLYESVPPRLYGGTERIVSYLTEALVDLGHEVTLFASGDSQTSEGAEKMGIDNDAGTAVGEWKRSGKLLESQFHDNKTREYPAIQVATPQVSQGSGGHHTV